MTVKTQGPTDVATPQAVTGDLVTGQRQQPPSRFVQFKHVLDKGMAQIKIALPKHIDPMRFYRVILTAMQSQPKPGQFGILDCTQESVFSCMLTCAQLGLEPNGPQGHAYLIPFRDNNANAVVCTLVVGYRGLVKLARNSGEISTVSARVVHEKDRFEYQFGLHEDCIHIPSDEEDPGPVVAAYAVWRLRDGSASFDVMTRRELDRIKNRKGPPKGFSPWTSDEEEMQRKTVLRRSSKLVPNSIELAKGLEANDRQEEGLAPIPMESAGEEPSALAGEKAQSQIEATPTTLDDKLEKARAKREAVATSASAEKRDAAPPVEATMPAGTPTTVTGTKSAKPDRTGAAKAETLYANPEQQKEIAIMCVDRTMGIEEVCQRYGVEKTSALSQERVLDAIAWLKTIPLPAEPGSEG